MVQIVIPVDKSNLHSLKTKLYNYVCAAQRVRDSSPYSVMREAEAALNNAKGIFETLGSLGLLEKCDVTQDDIDRIETKICDILDQKRIKGIIRRH